MCDNPKMRSRFEPRPGHGCLLPFLHDDATTSAMNAPLSKDTEALEGIDTGITWQYHNCHRKGQRAGSDLHLSLELTLIYF